VTFVKNRVPALSHAQNAIPRDKLKSLFKSGVEAALMTGELPSRNHGWKSVFDKFIDLMGPDGSWFPSHAKVAEKAGVSERTAWAAINALESIGLIRVEARYLYDPDKGKTVRTSNLYEVVVTKAQRAIAILAAAARKAKEAAKRQWAAASRSSMAEWGRRVIHHLPATDAEDPQLNIFKRGNQAEPSRNWSHNEWVEYCQTGNQTT
jgi:antitoxin (DNA-binding transcriptional repressor) of toxin-antitoxin stability system